MTHCLVHLVKVSEQPLRGLEFSLEDILLVFLVWSFVSVGQVRGLHFGLEFKILPEFDHLTHSATATAYVTSHYWSLTSKMTSWGAVRTGHDWSHTSKMTGWGAVCDRSHTSKMTGQ